MNSLGLKKTSRVWRASAVFILLLGVLLISVVFSKSTAVAGHGDPYADAVMAYSPGGDVGPPHDDPAQSLGAPDGNFATLGQMPSGSIILRFVDNVVFDGPGRDLAVYEVGSIENANVFVSGDNGATFVFLGPTRGLVSRFDISGTGLRCVNAIHIVDGGAPFDGEFPFAGFDVDAVEALNSADAEECPLSSSPSGKVYDVTATRLDTGEEFRNCYRFEEDGSFILESFGVGNWRDVFVGQRLAVWTATAVDPDTGTILSIIGLSFPKNGSGIIGRATTVGVPVSFALSGFENDDCSVD